jgi:hypothetical protein|nr:MAG TPA_asm: hypothetical protein [Caudoviricetes sp.]
MQEISGMLEKTLNQDEMQLYQAIKAAKRRKNQW